MSRIRPGHVCAPRTTRVARRGDRGIHASIGTTNNTGRDGIVGDYVIGGGIATWPPAGAVGSAVAGTGAEVPGGPGPGFHFPNNFAPGASFCLTQSQSPGNHPGP